MKRHMENGVGRQEDIMDRPCGRLVFGGGWTYTPQVSILISAAAISRSVQPDIPFYL
jgi:hypothetical protein